MTEASAPTPDRSKPISFRDPESALRAPVAHAWLWGVAICGLACDLWTKAWAFRTLDPLQPRNWIPHVLDFQLSLNAGALFGIGSGKSVLFITASLAALLFVVYLFSGTARDQRALHIALALILSGAMGNLYDRAMNRYDRALVAGSDRAIVGTVVPTEDESILTIRPWYHDDGVIRIARADLVEPVQRVGVVRDFLHLIPEFRGKALWPWVFNVADALLVAGVALLLIGYWRTAKREAANQQDANVAADTAQSV